MKLELTKTEESRNRGEDEYDVFTDPNEVARRRGQRVVFPEPNQLQIDIDSYRQFAEFERRFGSFDTLFGSQIQIKPSASGIPHRHITITHPVKVFTVEERLMWQAALNDDPVRVFLNALRLDNGDETPSRFFEPLE